MFNIQLKNVHVGEAIQKRIEELGMTKSEFGKRIGVKTQHIKRILERDTMETKKLMKVCEVLDFNFFSLFCEFPSSVSAYISAVTTNGGDATLQLGDSACIFELEKKSAMVESREREIELLYQHIATLKEVIATKDEMISMLKK